MPNIKSAIKRSRQNNKQRRHNSAQRSMFRTAIKKVVYAIEAGDAKEATTALSQAQPIIDKAVNKGLIHKNKAARHKSRLISRIKQLQA